MSCVNYRPWIGNNYWDGGCFGKKILVLGESHYGDNWNSFLTQNVMLDHVYDRTRATYTNFERALKGSTTNGDDRECIWQSVAFYNYIQEPLSGPRESPTQSQFEDAEEAFFEILDELEPDVVLIWGTRLWDNLPYTNFKSYGDCTYKGYSYRSGSYTTDNGTEVICYEMQHPSSGFSWSWWNGFLTENNII